MDLLLLTLLILVASNQVSSAFTGGKIAPTNSTSPQFHHRVWHSAIVLGNYLYIDGGEIATWDLPRIFAKSHVEGVGDPVEKSNIVDLPSNWTYSIDLSSSWTNQSLTLLPISKESLVLNQEALWPDAKGETFYSFDGGVSPVLALGWEGQAPSSTQFWQFIPSGDGSGHWTPASISGSSALPSLAQVYQCYFAHGNGLGFALGGLESVLSYYWYDSEPNYLPGMIVFNDTSQEWYNVSTTAFTASGLANNGAAQFVPSFGPEGLLFVFGGETAETSDGTTMPLSLDLAYIYEPVSRQWQQQQVTGEPPAALSDQCLVGVQGDNGTYEIFMYGGNVNGDAESTVNLGAVWVLSLPSFHWIRQAEPLPFGRFGHICNVVGNRQMISTGGIVIYSDFDADSFAYGTADPWDQGIGIFDLSEMEWKPSYDASAPAYMTPTIVKNYLEHSGPSPAAGWQNEIVKGWFAQQASSSSTSPSNDDSSSANVGAIAGGVVGGVVGLALVLVIAWCCLARRKRKERIAAAKQNTSYASEVKELPATNARFELHGKSRAVEPDGFPIHELEGR